MQVTIEKLNNDGSVKNPYFRDGQKHTGEMHHDLVIGHPFRVGTVVTSIVKSISVKEIGIVFETSNSTYLLRI